MEAPARVDGEGERDLERDESLARDVFLLFNSRQPGVALINAALHEHGITTWYSPNEFEIDEESDAREASALERARTVVVVLGDQGWGHIHRELTKRTSERSTHVVPVVIGDAPIAALLELDGLFGSFNQIHFKSVDDKQAIDALVRALRDMPSEPPTPRARLQSLGLPAAPNQAALLQRLTEGDEDSRAEILDELVVLADRYDFADLQDSIAKQMRILSGDAAIDPDASLRAALASALLTCWTHRERRGGDSHPEVRDLALHLTSPGESNSAVRFAAIAGVLRAKGTIDRVTTSHPNHAIAVLVDSATARSNSGGASHDPVPLLVHSSDADYREVAYRVLRVLPNPGLVTPSFFEAMLSTGSNVATEAKAALWAITEPAVMDRVVVVTIQNPELVFARIAQGCAGAGRYLLDRTVRLVLRLDRSFRDDHLARCRLSGGEIARGAERLLERLAQRSRRHLAGYVPEVTDVSDDLELSKDRLDIALDVKTLSALTLATDVKPPLSIGLFGNWGTGKTFFMDCMQAEVTRLSREARAADEKRFHTRVAQIRFNAWHYIDANLWASLVSHIIEELARQVQPGEDPATARKNLVTQLQTAQELKREAEDEKARASEARSKAEDELKRLADERASKQLQLSSLRASDLWEVIRDDPALNRALDDASEKLGVPKAVASVQELEAVVRDAHRAGGRVQALVFEVLRHPGRLAWLALVIVALFAVPAALALSRDWLRHPPPIFATLSAFMAQLATGAAVLTALLRAPLHAVSVALRKLDAARQAALAQLEKKRAQRSSEEIALEKELRELNAKESSATHQLTTANARVAEIEAKIREIDDGRSLSKYLLQRFQTEDYRRHLGLVSTIRRDFEQLARLLKIAAAEAQTEPIQRIVLYVDDLDRCPAPRVLEVLQAVHLLLAFELFVVVVGVDPRWLLHSLERSYSAFRRGGSSRGNAMRGRRWVTTPQNYLEKIFQIPFSLRPMGEAGFGKLLDALLPDTQPGGAVGTAVDAAAPLATVGGRPGATATSTSTNMSPEASIDAAGTRPSAAHVLAQQQQQQQAHPAPPPPPQLNYDALRIRPWERAYAARLHAFMPSPRAAKRFANVYRLLKAPLDHDELRRFEGTQDAPGEFRIAMLLLAISTGFANSAPALFTSLLETSHPPPEPRAWLDALEREASPTADIARICNSLRPLLSDQIAPTIEPLAAWAHRVRRFSFDSPNEGTG